MLVDGARDEFFAAACFSGHENGPGDSGRRSHPFGQLLHHFAFSNHVTYSRRLPENGHMNIDPSEIRMLVRIATQRTGVRCTMKISNRTRRSKRWRPFENSVKSDSRGRSSARSSAIRCGITGGDGVLAEDLEHDR